ncbi:MAG: alpha/beta fold hydrolase [Ancrocorticia sp.]|uniref:alpha/beta fold hydrolase n=1 Tax=Ancrocorticia sp. TaxID=2593684 RepID=UPI003F93F724
MATPADNSCVFIPGPWSHRFIQANGCQFHLAHMGEHRDDRPLVLLVHGHPEYWWAWRHQLEPIAQAGYEVAAIDQRGLGGSDKTPEGVDAGTLTRDLSGIARSLGASRVVVIGLGRGGMLAWAAPAMFPDLVAGILTFSAPHTRTLQRAGMHVTFRTWRHVAQTFVSPLARKALRNESYVKGLLAEWSAPGNDGATSQAEHYAAAMRLPEAADIAVEQLRWSYTSTTRPDGRKFFDVTKRDIEVPVWTVRGDLDPLLPKRAWHRDAEFVTNTYRHITVPGAGHFVNEEAPEESTSIILEFLASLP